MNTQTNIRRPCPTCQGSGWIGGARVVALSRINRAKQPITTGKPCGACNGSGWLNRQCQALGSFLAFTDKTVRCPLWAVEGAAYCGKHAK